MSERMHPAHVVLDCVDEGVAAAAERVGIVAGLDRHFDPGLDHHANGSNHRKTVSLGRGPVVPLPDLTLTKPTDLTAGGMGIMRRVVLFDASDLAAESSLDLHVDDPAAAHTKAIALGERLLKAAEDLTTPDGHQVYADPAGHTFCIGWGHPDDEAVSSFLRKTT